MALTPKQQAFVEAYAGNGTEAARLAGYSGSDAVLAVTAHDLLRNPKVAAALEARRKAPSAKRIASREERQAFWTSVLDDPNAAMNDRLRASELLGKSEADFVERHQHSGGVSISVVDPYAVKPGA